MPRRQTRVAGGLFDIDKDSRQRRRAAKLIVGTIVNFAILQYANAAQTFVEVELFYLY